MPTRDEWIEAGLEALARGGEGALRVDRLALALGVTKGSFHHHFRGAADLRTSVLEAHRAAQFELVDAITAGVESMDAEAAIAHLGALVSRAPDNPLERAVRAWAAVDGAARAVQEEIDAARLAALEAVWLRVLPAPQARTAALLPLLMLIGASASTVASPEDVQAVLRMLALQATQLEQIADRL